MKTSLDILNDRHLEAFPSLRPENNENVRNSRSSEETIQKNRARHDFVNANIREHGPLDTIREKVRIPDHLKGGGQ